MKKVFWALRYGFTNKKKLVEAYAACTNPQEKEFIEFCINQDNQITSDSIFLSASKMSISDRKSLLSLLKQRLSYSELLALTSCSEVLQMNLYNEILPVWKSDFFRNSALKQIKIINSDEIIAELTRLESLDDDRSAAAAISLLNQFDFSDEAVVRALAGKINSVASPRVKDFVRNISVEHDSLKPISVYMKSIHQNYLKKKRLYREHPLLVADKSNLERSLGKATEQGYFLLDLIWYDFILNEGRLEKVGEYDFSRKASREIDGIKDFSRLSYMFRVYAKRRDINVSWDKNMHENIGLIHYRGIQRARKENSDTLLLAIEASAKNHMDSLRALSSSQGVKSAVTSFFSKVPPHCNELYSIGQRVFPHVTHLRKRRTSTKMTNKPVEVMK